MIVKVDKIFDEENYLLHQVEMTYLQYVTELLRITKDPDMLSCIRMSQ